MDYVGLLTKYPVSRPLTTTEREDQLKQGDRLSVEPLYQLAVVRLNSTFLEITDKFYAWKGLLTAVLLVVFLVVALFLGTMLGAALIAPFLAPGSNLRVALDPNLIHVTPDYGVAAFVLVLTSPLLAVIIWAFLKDSFTYTHFPIRLNRITGMVHVFRRDGTTLSVPWKDLFFTLGQERSFAGIKAWDIRAHVLDSAKENVVESFALDFVSTSREMLRQHWEFVRRYMEQGPREAYILVQRFPWIGLRRDTLLFGLQRLMFNLYGTAFGAWLLFPFFVWFGIGRWVAMQTSKRPAFSAIIEEECTVADDDPFCKDATDNPKDMSGWWFT